MIAGPRSARESWESARVRACGRAEVNGHPVHPVYRA